MRHAIVLSANYDYVNAAETTLKSIFYHTPHAQVYLANMDILQEWFTNINQKLAGINPSYRNISCIGNSF